MANVYVDLPLPVLNGPGPAVNTSAMGATRTIVVGGSFPGCVLTVEVSADGGANWGPLCSFQDSSGERVVAVAAQFMRVVVAGRKASVPFSANVDVASNDDGGTFLGIPLPVGNGAGAPVNATTLGTFSTFVCSGSFAGAAITVEVSEDGTDWEAVTSWAGYGGVVSRKLTAFRYRAVVAGRKASVPFSATLAVGSINDPSPAGGITELTQDVLAGPGSGSQAATVVGIQTTPVAAAPPAAGDVLTYNGGTSQWEPTAPAAGGITELTGDVIAGPGSGTVGAIVAGIEGVPVDATPPVAGDVLAYNGVWWTPTPPAPGGVTAVTATAPLSSTGGATPDISLATAMSGDLSGSYPSPTVVALQGNAVSPAAPVDNQVLTWNGLAWVPGSIAQGGSGGGGQLYYMNQGTPAQAPTVGLDASVKQLGKVAEIPPSTVTSAALPTVGSAVVASFVTDTGVPGLSAIPAGLWDYNVWASSATSVTPGEIVLIYEVFSYDGATATLVATSGDIPLFDPTSTIEYDASAIIPQTPILTTDRVYVEVRARAANPGQTITLYFGDGTPSHIHTTLPSVAGTGIVHVVNGAFVSPAAPVDLTSPFEATGTLPVGNGGTGLAAAPLNGELLIGDGVGYTLATLTAGANIAITNAPGSITIDSTASVADIAKSAVRVATTAALPANTFAAGVLTASANGSINATGIDGVTTLAVADRVLVKNEAAANANLIYEITDLGAAGSGPVTPTVLPTPPAYPGALLTCGPSGTYATLTAAVAAAVNGDRVQILPGTIVEAATVTVGVSIEIFGTGATCIVQRDSTGAVITVAAPSVYLHDFRIVNNQVPSADPGGQSCCVNADTMNRTSTDGQGGMYFANLALTYPKVGIFVSGKFWTVRDCVFTPNTGLPNTTLRALFAYGTEGQSFVYQNTFNRCDPGAAGDARMTAIYLNTRNDGIAPNWESGYIGDLVIDGNAITGGGAGAPRSYIDATSIYHQSGTAATFPPYGQFNLFIVNNDFSVNHASSPCVFFGRYYGAVPVLPLSFFGSLVVSNNQFGARVSSTQKGALFFTNTSGGAQAMGTFGTGFFGAGNVVAPAVLGGTVASIMADSSLLAVREIAFYNAPAPLLTQTPVVAGSPWVFTWAADFDTNAEVTRGVFTSVNEGTQNAQTSWILITADPIVVGTTNLAWELFGKALTIAEEGSPVVLMTKQINFVGGGVTATSAGNGVATVTVPAATNYWQRTGAVLSPATAGDSVSINSPNFPALEVIGLGPAVYVADAVDGQFFEINSSLWSATWTDPTGPTNATVIDAYNVVVSDGANLNAHVEADKFFVTDNSVTTTVQVSMNAGVATIATTDGVTQTPLDLEINELRILTNPGAAGDVLTSQGAGLPPTWSPGGGGGGGGRFYPPEQWTHKNVTSAQPATDQSCQVSTDYNTWKATRNGSITALTTRLVNAMTAGTLDVTVTINGVPGTLTLSHTSVLNTTGGIATQAAGIDTYVAGDLLGINFATDATFAPNNDLESYIELQDA